MRFTAVIEQSGRTATGFEVDAAPREVEVPEDFRAALEAVPEAGAAFARLPYSHQRAHVDAIAEAKKPETRRRRIDRAVEMLTRGKPAG